MSTAAGDESFDFVKTTSLNDSAAYEDITSPTFDTEYKLDSPSHAPSYTDPTEQDKQIELWKEELDAVEADIKSMSLVLNKRIERSNELKRNLGLMTNNPLKDIQSSLQSGVKSIRDSKTMQKTNETIDKWNNKLHETAVYQKTSQVAKNMQDKTSSALSTIGTSMSKKIGDIRNSQTFKSLEEKVETTYTSVKAKVRGSKSDNNLDEAIEEDEPTSTENPNADEQIPL